MKLNAVDSLKVKQILDGTQPQPDTGSNQNSTTTKKHYGATLEGNDSLTSIASKRHCPSKHLVVDEKWAILSAILRSGLNPKSKSVDTTISQNVGQMFGVSADTVKRIWTQYSSQIANGVLTPNLNPIRPSGRPSELTAKKEQAIVDSSAKRRYHTTYRSVSCDAHLDSHVSIPPTCVWRYMKRMGYDEHTENSKSKLRIANQIKRLEWTLDELSLNPETGDYFFRNLKKRAFFDEKIFSLKLKSKIRKRIGDPSYPAPVIQNKLHPPQVMISAGFGYPQQKEDGTYFNGNLGIYPFVERVVAKRSSVHRQAGTSETKPVNVTGQVYYDSMIGKGKIFDQIQAGVIGLDIDEIVIQLDNAPPHIAQSNISRLNILGASLAVPIRIRLQPAQSPEFNLMDLGIWYSLDKQADYFIGDHRNIDDIINNVESAYNNYSVDKLHRVYAVYYVIMREVLKAHGGNHFKLPHTGIRQRQLEGLLPTENRFVSKELRDEAAAALVVLRLQL